MSTTEKKSLFPHNCPNCFDLKTAPDGLDENELGPGTVAVCNRCGAVLVVGDNLTMRVPTHEEQVEIIRGDLNGEILAAVKAARGLDQN